MKENTSIKMKRGLVLSLFGIVFSVFLVASASALFMGITDGYVKSMSGAIISGASVSVTVSGCSNGFLLSNAHTKNLEVKPVRAGQRLTTCYVFFYFFCILFIKAVNPEKVIHFFF